MVQVDVFWSYALGSSLACAAQRQLEKEDKPSATPYFLKTVLYLSLLFGPSGIYLLWQFTGWETMFVFDKTIPAWLVTGFAITNVTQGILGFFVCYWLIRAGKVYAANLQWVFGYLFMFFILVHGWDGTGFRRFFYSGDIVQWRAGVEYPIYAWFYSDVALTLYVMGLILLPVLFLTVSRWLTRGYQEAGLELQQDLLPSPMQIIKTILFVVLVLTLGAVIAASILVHLLGWLFGMVLFWPLFIWFFLRRGGLIHQKIATITLEQTATTDYS